MIEILHSQRRNLFVAMPLTLHAIIIKRDGLIIEYCFQDQAEFVAKCIGIHQNARAVTDQSPLNISIELQNRSIQLTFDLMQDAADAIRCDQTRLTPQLARQREIQDIFIIQRIIRQFIPRRKIVKNLIIPIHILIAIYRKTAGAEIYDISINGLLRHSKMFSQLSL